MHGLNRCYLIGRVGTAPELRATAGGVDLVKFRMATPRSRKEGNAWVEDTDWHSVVGWDSVARYVVTYVPKGAMVALEGSIRQHSWTVGETRHSRTEIIAERILWVQSPRPKPEDAPAAEGGGVGDSALPDDVDLPLDDDIPF